MLGGSSEIQQEITLLQRGSGRYFCREGWSPSPYGCLMSLGGGLCISKKRIRQKASACHWKIRGNRSFNLRFQVLKEVNFV